MIKVIREVLPLLIIPDLIPTPPLHYLVLPTIMHSTTPRRQVRVMISTDFPGPMASSRICSSLKTRQFLLKLCRTIRQASSRTIPSECHWSVNVAYKACHLLTSQQNQGSIDPALVPRKPSNHATPPPPPITRQGWRALVSAMPDSKSQGNFLIKSNAEFPARTNSKHLAGFVFVGNDHLEVGTTKGKCSN